MITKGGLKLGISKGIKVEWCENWIKALFEKHHPQMSGIYTELFWKLAEKSGLWIKDSYGSPMSKALSNLTVIETISDNNGEFLYNIFKLKSC